MANQLQNTQLGSQTNLFYASSNEGDSYPKRPGTTSSLPSPSSTGRCSTDRLIPARAASLDNDQESWPRQSTPCRTPQPSERRYRHVRRASDPIPGADKELSALKQLQRFNSLNGKNPLPIPDSMKSLKLKDNGSSRSSIATELSEPQILNDLPVDEDALNQRLVDDDLIIPDDMKDFLNEHCHQADSTVPEYTKAHKVMRSPASIDSGREQVSVPSCMMEPRPPPNPPPGNRRPASRQMVSPVSPPMVPQQHQQQQNWGPNTPSCQMVSPMPMGPNSNSMQQMSSHQNMSCQSCHSYNAGMPTVPCQNCSMGPQMQQSSMNSMPQYMANNPVNNMHCGNLVVTQGGMPMQQNYSNQWQNNMQHNMQPNMNMQMANSMQQQNIMQCNNNMQQNQMMPMVQKQQMYANQQQMMANHNMGMQNMQVQQMGMNHMMVHKQERQSPQVQVPQISQSQIPPRAKAANRNTGTQHNMQMQQPCVKQYSASYDNGHNACAMPNTMNYNNTSQNSMQTYNFMQGNMSYNNPATPVMCNNSMGSMNAQSSCHHNNMPYQRAMSQPNSCMGNISNMNHGQIQGGNHPNMMNVQMSPNCNQVSSTTELHNHNNMPPPNNLPDNYMSTSTENILDNLSSISMENVGGQVISPTALLNRSQTSSRMSTQSHPMIDTSNMVVNDMSSMLNAYAEENKYLMR